MSTHFQGTWWIPPTIESGDSNNDDKYRDLELGVITPPFEPEPKGATSQAPNVAYYRRLCKDEFLCKRSKCAREFKAYVFTHLRELCAAAVSDKILFLENKLHRDGLLDGDELDALMDLLHRNTELARDFEYMTNPSFEQSVDKDNEIVSRERFPQYENLRHLGMGKHKSVVSIRPAPVNPLPLLLARLLPPYISCPSREYQRRQGHYTNSRPPLLPSYTVRMIAAAITTVAGGSFIILPMVLMSVAPSILKSLVTVSVSVLLFGFVVELFIARTNSETFLFTVTYAAVLVVFVASSGLEKK